MLNIGINFVLSSKLEPVSKLILFPNVHADTVVLGDLGISLPSIYLFVLKLVVYRARYISPFVVDTRADYLRV